MSITDELRAWAHGPDEGDDWLDRIDEFCDRIDAAHRSALEKLAAQVDESERIGFDQGFASADDWLAQHEDAMAEHGWIRLPLDADGVTIRVGDRLSGYNKTIEVVELRHGRSGWVLISRDGNAYADTFAFSHHHAPTVEDVLREFADRYLDYEGIPSAGRRGVGEALMDEYAKRLRLAEGVDA